MGRRPSARSASRLRVGFIGLGDQGSPMAVRLVDAGLIVTLWARRPTVAERFRGRATIVDSPAAVGRCSDVVGVCVRDDDDVSEVVLGRDGILEGALPGCVIAIHSTVSPGLCSDLDELARRRQCRVVDAPVSGGAARAASGDLLVMIGGDDASIERCMPALVTFASSVVRTGGLGSGQVAKLLNNALFVAHAALAEEIFSLGRALGIEFDALAACLMHGSGRSRGLEWCAGLGGDLGLLPSTTAALLAKDVELAAALPGLRGSAILGVATSGVARATTALTDVNPA